MKRKVYQISKNGELICCAYAWNSARKRVIEHVRALARAQSTEYRLVSGAYSKDATGAHVTGAQTWAKVGTTDHVTFAIERVE